MPISLKTTISSSSGNNYLAAGNLTNPVGLNTIGARWSNIISVTNVNISAALTQMASVNVPVGELIVIKAISLSDLTTASATLDFQLEVDGVIVLSYSGLNTLDRICMVGNDIGSVAGNTYSNEIITDIEVRSNFRVLVRKPAVTTADLAVTYAKIKRG